MSRGDPKKQLHFVLAGGDNGTDIHDLYKKILDHHFTSPDDGTVQSFQNILGFIVLSKVPPSCELLIHLLQLQGEETSVEFILTNLYSVISTGESNPVLQICHQSFVDFLTDSKRKSEPFFIDRSKQSLHLLQCCFQTMNSGLRFNICNLKNSHQFNDNIPSLAGCITANISAELGYSCCFWAHHLWEASEISEDHSSLIMEMRKFLYNHLLSWLEVLSLKKEVLSAAGALNSLAEQISASIIHIALVF